MKSSWEWTEEELLLMKTTQTPESLCLDFKGSLSLTNTDKKKDEIAKDVSAFANSAGGDILYGVSETESSPARFKDLDGGVDPKTVTPEWLESVINSNIQPRITGIRITPIELKQTSPGRYSYAVHIPTSYNAPHQAPDKRYYKRFNFMSIPMEDYEIRDISNRSDKPALKADGEIIKIRLHPLTRFEMLGRGGATIRIPSFDLRLWLLNVGKTTAKNTIIVLSFENLKIGKVRGQASRLDDLRGGKPSMQFSLVGEVFHPKNRTKIADVNLQVIDLKKPCSISTEVSAEDLCITEHRYSFYNGDLFFADLCDSDGKKMKLFLSGLERMWTERHGVKEL